MSRFFNPAYNALVPYVPGEQPQDKKYLKLNTNESPFAPSPAVVEAVTREAGRLQLYSDPAARELTASLAETLDVSPEEIILTNGSDEVLQFAFMAFCSKERPAAFPDITYGFYPVFAQLCGVPYKEIPLRDDFSIALSDYKGLPHTVFIANPNAPTGLVLNRDTLEAFIAEDPERVVVVDEAYVDFGAESCVPLIHKHDNLLVTQTFSKSRSMAGARLGFGVGCVSLIRDLQTLRGSTNPYNVNRMTMAAGLATLAEPDRTKENCRIIAENREYLKKELRKRGFTVTDSAANFVFAAHKTVGGKTLYEKLRENGVLVRHFSLERIKEYNRITVGTREQTDTLLAAIDRILEEIA